MWCTFFGVEHFLLSTFNRLKLAIHERLCRPKIHFAFTLTAYIGGYIELNKLYELLIYTNIE